MNAEEAQYLLTLVSDTYGDDAAYRYRLSGSPSVWVVRICMGDQDFWLWSHACWKQYRRAEKTAARIEKARANAERTARAREALACA